MKSVKTHKMMHKLCMAFVVLFAALATAHADVDWSQFECSFSVKFPGYRGSSTLTDFPVLIRLSAALNDFNYSKCADNGADIRFSDSDGNLLSHEIDTWNTNGESLVWVKVPTLNKNTTIKAYYGCATPPAVTASDVWTNGYVGVWHLGAANDTTQRDSTTNKLDFVCADGDVGKVDLAVSSGAVGGAVGFNRDETKKGGLSVSDSSDVLAGSDDLTLEAWIYPTQIDTVNNRFILAKRASSANATYYVYANNGREGTPTIAVSKGSDDSNATYPGAKTDPPPVNSWTHMAFTRVGATKSITEYLDGTNLISMTQTGTAGSLYRGGHSVVLGNDKTTSASCFPGNVDEVRISCVARSAEWVQATRDTIADDGFAAYEGDDKDWERYSHKFTVSFPGGPENAALANFPVLVKIAEYDENAGTGIQGFSYEDCRKLNGGDLRFADENGTLLDSEVEIWNPQGESLVWVKVPTLIKGTKITGYYGWLLAPSLDPTAVWDENYVGVWHMDENNAATMLADSTANARSFVRSKNYPNGMTNGVLGVVGSSIKFNGGDSKGQYAIPDSAGNFDGFNAITVEAWTWQDDHNATENSKTRYVLRKYDGASTASWFLVEIGGKPTPSDNGKYSFQFYDSNSIWKEISIDGDWTKPSRADWNHSVSVWDGGAGVRNSYLNGSQLSSYSASDAYKGQLLSITASNAMLCLGNIWEGGTAQFPGKLDEVRISKVARSSEWIKATYDTIKNNADFTAYSNVRENKKLGLHIIVR